MSPERVFSICNTVALVGWLLLAAFPRRRQINLIVCGTLLPALLALGYLALLAARVGSAHGSFAALAGVAQLFSDPWLLLAGWVHYLAFDLFVGSWEARDAQARGVPRWALWPCLFLTFMVGPVGLLAYLAARRLSRGAEPKVQSPAL